MSESVPLLQQFECTCEPLATRQVGQLRIHILHGLRVCRGRTEFEACS